MAYVIINKEYRVHNVGSEEAPIIKTDIKYTLSNGINTLIEYVDIKPEDMEAVDVAVLDGLDTLVLGNVNT